MASREPHDVMAGLLKRNLAGDAGAGNGCPGPDILGAYFERSLDADEIAHVELHLSDCARCREQLAALGRAEEAAAPATATPPKAARASWIWDWRWLAPVAAALILTAVWATRRPELTRIAEHPEQAAATTATPQPVQQPVQHKAQQAMQQDKQPAASRVATPAPSAAPPPAPAPAANFTAGVGAGASAENSRSTNAVARKSAAREELSKKSAQQQATADQAANAPSAAIASESATVESAAPAVGGAPVAPSPARASSASAPQPNVGGLVGGAASGPSRAKVQPSKEKEAPALVSALRARPEIIAENQAGELSSAHIITTSDSKILWRIASGGFIRARKSAGLSATTESSFSPRTRRTGV